MVLKQSEINFLSQILEQNNKIDLESDLYSIDSNVFLWEVSFSKPSQNAFNDFNILSKEMKNLEDILRFFEAIAYNSEKSLIISLDSIVSEMGNNKDSQNRILRFLLNCCKNLNDEQENLITEKFNECVITKMMYDLGGELGSFDLGFSYEEQDLVEFYLLSSLLIRHAKNEGRILNLPIENLVRVVKLSLLGVLSENLTISLCIFINEVAISLNSHFLELISLKYEKVIEFIPHIKSRVILECIFMFMSNLIDDEVNIISPYLYRLLSQINLEIDLKYFAQIFNRNPTFRKSILNDFTDKYSCNEISDASIYVLMSMEMEIIVNKERKPVDSYNELACINNCFQKLCESRYLRAILSKLANYQLSSKNISIQFLGNYFNNIRLFFDDIKNYTEAIQNLILYYLYDKDNIDLKNFTIQTISNSFSTILSLVTEKDFMKYYELIKGCCRIVPDLGLAIQDEAKKSKSNIQCPVLEVYAFLKLIKHTDLENVETGLSPKIKNTMNYIIEFFSKQIDEETFIEKMNPILNEIEEFDYLYISYEKSQSLDTLENWIIKTFYYIGFQKLKLDSLWDFQLYLFNETMKSYSFITMLSNDTHFCIRNYLASHYRKLFEGELTKEADAKFIEVSNTLAFNISFEKPRQIPPYLMDFFQELMRSRAVEKAFSKIELDLSKGAGFEKRVYYATLSSNTAGVTVFGGAILIHSKYTCETNIGYCINLITFLHELAHAIRKFSNELGCYESTKHTPVKNQHYYEGMPGDSANSTFKESLNEGGVSLEVALFGCYMAKINESQLGYLLEKYNWTKTLKEFKSDLETLSLRIGTVYSIPHKGLGNCYSIWRPYHTW